MTDHEFDEVLHRLCPGTRARGSSRAIAAVMVAAEMFRNRNAESEDTMALRHQLNCLHHRGAFDFSAWHTD